MSTDTRATPAETDAHTHAALLDGLRRTGLLFGVAETDDETGRTIPLFVLLRAKHTDRSTDIVYIAETIASLCAFMDAIPVEPT